MVHSSSQKQTQILYIANKSNALSIRIQPIIFAALIDLISLHLKQISDTSNVSCYERKRSLLKSSPEKYLESELMPDDNKRRL
jgi:hypothetical protein